MYMYMYILCMHNMYMDMGMDSCTLICDVQACGTVSSSAVHCTARLDESKRLAGVRVTLTAEYGLIIQSKWLFRISTRSRLVCTRNSMSCHL